MGGDGVNLVQGNLKHFGALAAQRPATQPAAVVVVVDANHLIQVISSIQADAGSLVEFCGWSRTGKRSHGAGLGNDMAAWERTEIGVDRSILQTGGPWKSSV